MHQIIDNLYLGDAEDIKLSPAFIPVDVRGIISHGFTPEKNLDGCKALVSAIHALLLMGKKVVVFCDGGIERSPLVVTYYLTVFKRFNVERAYSHIIGIRPCVARRYGWIKKAMERE